MDLKMLPPSRAIMGQNKLFISVMTTDMKLPFPKYLGFMNVTASNLTAVQTRMPLLVSQSWAAPDKFQLVAASSASNTSRLLQDADHFDAEWKSVSQDVKPVYQIDSIRKIRRAFAKAHSNNKRKLKDRLSASSEHHRPRKLQSEPAAEVNYYGKSIPTSTDVVLETIKVSGASLTAMTYLPFFSNCEFYGSYLYLAALFEAHPRCNLIPESEVIPIDNFKFGMQPKADSCNQIIIDCKYSENVTGLDADQTYWFQAKTQEVIFSFYLDPVTSDEFAKINDGQISLNSEDVG